MTPAIVGAQRARGNATSVECGVNNSVAWRGAKLLVVSVSGGDLHFDGTKYRREVRQPRTRKVKLRTQSQDPSRAMDPRSTKSIAPDAQPDRIDPDPKIWWGIPGSISVNECLAVLERHVAGKSRKYPYTKFAGRIFRKSYFDELFEEGGEPRRASPAQFR